MEKFLPSSAWPEDPEPWQVIFVQSERNTDYQVSLDSPQWRILPPVRSGQAEIRCLYIYYRPEEPNPPPGSGIFGMSIGLPPVTEELIYRIFIFNHAARMVGNSIKVYVDDPATTTFTAINPTPLPNENIEGTLSRGYTWVLPATIKTFYSVDGGWQHN